ncbi:MAG TPA: FtsX-like permease family protein, partial [Gaiellaceae bacterium]|nr:FtsX-like permease family protein [Gaiellaceae bacterium]
VIAEAAAMGLAASLVGLAAGYGLARGLTALFDAMGLELPRGETVFAGGTVAVALVTGTVVTVLAGLAPALRATRVPPIAAVREGATLPESRLARFRTAGSLVTIAVGFASLAYGLFGDDLGTTQLLAWMGLGALLVFVGVALFSQRLVVPLVAALGWPARRIGGVAGKLARDNARRNPQRTASTAAALMIGLALVTLVAVLAKGITSTFTDSVDALFRGDYAITAQNNFSPIPIAAAEAAAGARGVEAVGSVRTAEAEVFGEREFITAVTPDVGRVLELDWQEGSQEVFGTLGARGAIVDDSFAEEHGLSVGSPLELLTPAGETIELEVAGIFEPPTGGSPFGPVTFSAETFDRNYDSPRNLFSFVLMEGGETEENTAALTAALADFPNAKAQTRDEFVDNQISGLSAILNVLYVLLALSVVVSLFGIVNTLVLTVFERTRELGMLRAIGMTRRQTRRMIRHESVITALMGGAIGIVLGALLVARVEFIDFSLPVVQIVVFAILTVVVGIIAAIFPARRAARLNPLDALQYE